LEKATEHIRGVRRDWLLG